MLQSCAMVFLWDLLTWQGLQNIISNYRTDDNRFLKSDYFKTGKTRV